MGIAKDIVKDNKKILLLTGGLLVVSVIGVFLLNEDLLGIDSDDINVGQYTQAQDVLQEGIDYKATIRTEYGDINIDLFEEESPHAVNSFVFLSGNDFYDDLTFYKVIKNFVIQAGDQVGDGTGDPGYSLEQDINDLEPDEYTVCMANASQFFIILPGASLDQFIDYPIIGEVTSGFAVVDNIAKASVDANYKPVNDITINSILIIEE
ncbi:MAG: peptidylprolyl isomerase [Candidatus Dojkabacteria bacterium]|nr:peptidylprolyl isomerase [Candidatus Dojkabacteria bacterium]